MFVNFTCRQNCRPLLMSAILFLKMAALKHLNRVITRLQMHLETLFLSLHPHFRCSGSRKRCQYGDPRWRSKMADIKFQYGRRYIIKFFLDAYVIRIYYFIIRQYYEHNNVYIVYVT